MIKEFSDNVQRLFNDIVTDKTKEHSHTAKKLLFSELNLSSMRGSRPKGGMLSFEDISPKQQFIRKYTTNKYYPVS